MSKINLELFLKDCELISFEYKRDGNLVFEFTEEVDGYICLGSRTARIKGKSCAIDVRDLECGEHIPRLILEDMTIDLVKIRNENGAIYPKEREACEIGDLSLRERRLKRRTDELELRLEILEKKVFGTSIF